MEDEKKEIIEEEKKEIVEEVKDEVARGEEKAPEEEKKDEEVGA